MHLNSLNHDSSQLLQPTPSMPIILIQECLFIQELARKAFLAALTTLGLQHIHSLTN